MAQEQRVRSKAEVAQRALALIAVVGKGFGRSDVKEWVKLHQVAQYFSKAEASFFNNPSPSKREIVNFSWRAEALVPLIWSLRYLETLPPVNQQFALGPVVEASKIWADPGAFVRGARMREYQELVAAREEVLQQNWLARDARIHNKPMPFSVDPEVVEERHYALNWLAGDSGDDWDAIETDT